MTHTTFTVGQLRCHALEGGMQHLDGGAMFGVVPKPLWERRIPADARNRIPLALRCLLVEHDDGLVLIDTGIGNKENAKFRDIYGVDNGGADGRTQLEDALTGLGYKPEDVAWVINTHLHFDHAGGDTWVDPAGKIGPAFPKAHYVVQRRELDFARHTNERTAGSYLAHNARFDWAFVSKEIERSRGLLLQGPRVCTVRLARRLLPDLPRRNLDWVSGYFGIEIEGRHRAVGDAVAAAKCLARLLRLAKDEGVETLAELVAVRPSGRPAAQ